MLNNAIWNILAGLSAAILGVALPPFLTRWLPPETFGAWSLCLQVATYVNILNLGLQVIVAKLVADATARDDLEERDRVVATSIAMLVVAGVLGFGAIWFVSNHVRELVPRLGVQLVRDVRTALLLLAFAFSVMLPLSVFGAVFVGIRRNLFYASGLLASRGIGFFLIIAACFWSRDIRWMALQYLLSTLIAGGFWYAQWRVRIERPRLAIADVSRDTARTIIKDSATLSVWNIGMLMVSGLQIAIVARFDYANLPYFAAASTLTLFVSGVLQAICGTIVPESAHLAALGDGAGLRHMLFQVSRISTLISVVVTAPLIVLGGPILSLWVGPVYAEHAGMTLAILALGYSLRNLILAYAMMTVGLGRQRRLFFTPLLEGACSLTLGLLFGANYGAVGVAAGLVIGAVVGVAPLIYLNLLGDVLVPSSMVTFLTKNVLRPYVGIILAVVIKVIDVAFALPLTVQLLCTAGCFTTAWLVGTTPGDRKDIVAAGHRAGHRLRLAMGRAL